MRYKVEILEDNTIEVFDLDNPNKNNAPFLRQDVHPDGRVWANRTEAQTWIDNLIAEWNKPPVEEPVSE